MLNLKPIAVAIWLVALSQGVTVTSASDYSTGVNTDYPKRVFFGDLHLHSNISADAQIGRAHV